MVVGPGVGLGLDLGLGGQNVWGVVVLVDQVALD